MRALMISMMKRDDLDSNGVDKGTAQPIQGPPLGKYLQPSLRMKDLTVTVDWCGTISLVFLQKYFVMKMKAFGHYHEEPAAHQNWRFTHVAKPTPDLKLRTEVLHLSLGN